MKKVTMPINIGKPVPKLEISKDFNETDFIEELSRIPWYLAIQYMNPNDNWHVWKSFFWKLLTDMYP